MAVTLVDHAHSFIAVTLVAQYVKFKGNRYRLLKLLYRIYTGTVYLCVDVCSFVLTYLLRGNCLSANVSNVSI